MAQDMTAVACSLARDSGADDGMISSSVDLIEHLAQAVDALDGLGRVSRVVQLGPLVVHLTLHGAVDKLDIFDALPSVRSNTGVEQAAARECGVDLAINVIDNAHCGVPRPRLRWRASDFGFKHLVPGWSNTDRTTYFLRSECGLAIADWRAARVYVWVPSIAALATYDRAAPFRWIIDGLAQRHGLTPMHAAAIGEAGIGLLIVGEGGRGKSTLALAAIAADLDYLADDYCLVNVRPPYQAYRLFNTAKLRVDSKAAVRWIAGLEHDIEPGHGGKRIFNLVRLAPEALADRLEIRALLLPEFTDNVLPILERVSSSEAFQRAAPSTVAQCGESEAQTAADVGRLTRALPCYRIRVPREISLSIERIKRLIHALQASPEGASR
jgi:hypothetical protein